MTQALSNDVKNPFSGAFQTPVNLFEHPATREIHAGATHSTSATDLHSLTAVEKPLVAVGQLMTHGVGSVSRHLNPERAKSALAAQLYDIAATAKMATSKVSMHLTDSWRKRIYRQIDYLLSIENWDDDSVIPSLSSFLEFLRTVINYRGLPPPYLGVTGSGNIWASWRGPNHELTCEFVPLNQVRFVWRQKVDGEEEAAAWDGPVTKLRERLKQFDFVAALEHGEA